MLVFCGEKENGGGGEQTCTEDLVPGKALFFSEIIYYYQFPSAAPLPPPFRENLQPSRNRAGVRDLSGNLFVAFSPRDRRGGCHAGEEGTDGRDVSNRAILSPASLSFLFLSLLHYFFAIALENVGRGEIGEVLLQRPWGLGFFHAKILQVISKKTPRLNTFANNLSNSKLFSRCWGKKFLSESLGITVSLKCWKQLLVAVTQEIGLFQHLLTVRTLIKIRVVNLRFGLKAVLKKCIPRGTRQCGTSRAGRAALNCVQFCKHAHVIPSECPGSSRA